MEITLESSSLKSISAVSRARTMVQSNSVFWGEIGQVAHFGNGEEGLIGAATLSLY